MNSAPSPSALQARSEEILASHRDRIYRRTDRMFVVLLVVQWIGTIITAFVLSPKTYEGDIPSLHPHVLLAAFLGGSLAIFPAYMVWRHPGAVLTRNCVAIAQILFSGLLISITGGRIETHFHIFGSLAFLAAYRDPKVLIAPTLVAAADHLFRGVFWPETIFGSPSVSRWLWVEHTSWILFEDLFLVIAIRDSVNEMRTTARQTAELEESHARVQRQTEDLNRAFLKERAIVEGALDAVVGMDQFGKIIAWNTQAERIFGWTPEEAIGQSLSQLIIPMEYRGLHEDGLAVYRQSGQGPALNRRLEVPALHKTGRKFPIEAAITPIRNESETTFCAFVRDITDRKESEAALRRSDSQSRRLALVAARTHNAVVITDADGNIEWVNEGFSRITEYTAEEVIGRKPGAFLQGPNTDLEQIETMRRKIAAAEPVQVEVVNYTKSGREYWIAIEVQPLRDPSGQLTGYMAIESDITARKSAERELRRAKEAAEAASNAKSAFLANMSHEIRTPLTGILGFADVLRRDEISAKQARNYLNIIHSSGTHLLTLINDILDLSKIEAGRMEFDKTRCSPHQIVSDVLSCLRVRAQEKGLKLECQWTTAVPEMIETDPARLRQLLTNLIANAIKFTERGSVDVRIAIDHSRGEAQLAVEVADTGIGIAPEFLDRIFQPFDQADNSITRKFGGTGLGLAISRHIAQGLGGDVTVMSEVGCGSTFRATIATGAIEGAALVPATTTETLKDVPRKPADNGKVTLSGRRVLLVEDGETNRDLISLILRRAGADVACAENGQEGVEAAERREFDLILMDMQMPVMDGYTAAKALRSRGCQAPIIALTAHAMRGDREKCLSAGCSGYLTKPIQIDRLLETVSFEIQAADSSVHSAVEWADDAIPCEPLGQIVSTLPMGIPKFRQIVERFIETLVRRRGEMQGAFDDCRWSDLSSAAHWLKGAGGTVGFDCFTEPARRLEQNALRGHAHDAQNCLKEIDCLMDRIAVTESATA